MALPDLMDDLARCLTERVPAEGMRGKPGSKAPLRLDVVHLVDDARKPGWDGADPRAGISIDEGKDENGAPLPVRIVSVVEKFGALPALESWTRVLAEELPEYPDMAEKATVRSEAALLVEHWDWITEQQWADELAEDVADLTGKVNAALLVRKEPRFRCPQCGERAELVVGGFLACPSEHEQSVRDLEAQQRRRPPMSSADVCEEFGIAVARLWQWHKRKRIKPVDSSGRTLMWLPWDVFCLVNPDISAALDERDRLDAAAG